ncbi:hypothetical protein ES708_30718 [subsurface metagenome]
MTYLDYTKPDYMTKMMNLCACLKKKANLTYAPAQSPHDIVLLLRDTESAGKYCKLTSNGSTAIHKCRLLLVKEVYESLGFIFPSDLTYRSLFNL